MRVRTDKKRNEILKIAKQVFICEGYDGASMTQIATILGGSKRTLYGYFRSKEQLFASVMHEVAKGFLDPVLADLEDAEGNIRDALARFAIAMMELTANSDSRQLLRTMIGVAGRSNIGKLFYEMGPARGVWVLTKYLKKQSSIGLLRDTDAKTMALHFTALVQAQTLIPHLLGLEEDAHDPTPSVKTAVDTFLAAYGTRPDAIEFAGRKEDRDDDVISNIPSRPCK